MTRSQQQQQQTIAAELIGDLILYSSPKTRTQINNTINTCTAGQNIYVTAVYDNPQYIGLEEKYISLPNTTEANIAIIQETKIQSTKNYIIQG